MEDFRDILWNKFSDSSGKNKLDYIWLNDCLAQNALCFIVGANKTRSNIRQFLDFLRKRGFTVTQVDYMGHSMGGIWGRLVAQRYSEDVFSYNEGYIHKLITVDTPHVGSFLADIGQLALDNADTIQIWGFPSARDYLCWFSEEFQHPFCHGAIEDLTKAGCVNWLADVSVPSHAIVGNKHIDTACALLSFDDEIPGSSAKALSKILRINEKILKQINANWGCENWIDLWDIPTFTDYIVGVESQKGGLEETQSTEFNHWHCDCFNENVNGELLTLLNTPVKADAFADGFSASGDLMGRGYQGVPKALSGVSAPKALAGEGGGILFVTPEEGQIVAPGDFVNVEIAVTGELTLESLLAMAPGSDAVEFSNPPYTTSFEIPSNSYGTFAITALGDGTDGELYGSIVTLQVDNSATLEEIEVSPEALYLDIGQETEIQVRGKYSDGSLRDLSKAGDGTTYESSDEQVLLVDANGTCTGLSAGTASVTVRYFDEELMTVSVEVSEIYMDAAFSADCLSGIVPFTVHFTDLSAGYFTEWQWDFGDGNTIMEQNPTHTYTSPGWFTVCVTITGPGGTDTVTKTAYIKVTSCQGDFDTDGDVDGSDLAIFAEDFGRTNCSGDCEGDFDEDNDVDGSDLAVFAADFGRTDCLN